MYHLAVFTKTLLCAAERNTSLDLHRALWAAAMVAWLQRTLVSTSHRPSRALASQQSRSKCLELRQPRQRTLRQPQLF